MSTHSKKRHSHGSDLTRTSEDDRKHKKVKQASEGQAVFSWSSGSGSASDNKQRVEAVLVDSPSFTPPKSMTLYRDTNASSSSSSSSAMTHDSLMLGHRPAHAPKVLIQSSNWDFSNISPEDVDRTKGYTGSYLVGVYDPATRKVSLHPAPMLSISRTIVPQSADGSDATSIQIKSNYATARRDLGELFGNRKQKLAMRNADRMKVDTAGMDESILQGITDSVQDSKVESSQSQQPSQEGDEEHAQQPSASNLASRPIPMPHLEATSPEHIYPLSELFPPEIVSNVNASALMHAGDLEHVQKLLPGAVFKSNWLQSRIWSRVLAHRRNEGETHSGILKSSPSPQKTQVKQLLYIAMLWSIRSMAISSRSRILSDRKALKEKLKLQGKNGEGADPSAEALLDQILSIYCAKERANNRLHLTPFLDTKMLATICALCLHIDGFQLDPEVIASEMQMPPMKIKEVLKSLGCTTRYRNVVDVGSAASGTQEGGKGKNKKVMVLKCPVVLPEGRNGQPPKR